MMRIIKILTIGLIVFNLSNSQQQNSNNLHRATQTKINTEQAMRMQVHELMKKMHSTRNKDERRALIQEIRELRKNRGQIVQEQSNQEPKNEPRPTKQDTLNRAKDHTIPQSHPVEVSQLYQVPFASSGNRIELTIANGSQNEVTNVRVEAKELPEWIHITPSEQDIPVIKANEETQSQFTFSVEKSAPIIKEQLLNFNITTTNSETWTKQIRITITAPEKFELFQNYPNPFNPSTIINYQLPIDNWVTLKVYNVLGQEVATLVERVEAAGYKSVGWDAAQIPSGVYFYRLNAGTFSDMKKMLILR